MTLLGNFQPFISHRIFFDYGKTALEEFGAVFS